jgi:predicted nucleotidyltransferase
MPISIPPPYEKQLELAMLLKDAILGSYDPETIILFGSLGRGDADEFSDVDLLAVMETDRDINDLTAEINDSLDPITFDKHIIVRTPKDFYRYQDIPGTIVFAAVQEGRVLFEKTDWQKNEVQVDSYEVRKKEVLQKEYVQTADTFLAEADSFLQKDNPFRFRDALRFAVMRAIKGIFVVYDMNPPRGTDLRDLLTQAKELEPELSRYIEFMDELNNLVPNDKTPSEKHQTDELFSKTTEFVKDVISLYAMAP